MQLFDVAHGLHMDPCVTWMSYGPFQIQKLVYLGQISWFAQHSQVWEPLKKQYVLRYKKGFLCHGADKTNDPAVKLNYWQSI